jgi:2-succinyl-5-enolpyruvyl-6-hydroxy-3-cyclohexene-1-carboxylate synthase
MALVNPATAMATVLVDELVRHGVRDAVLCPGSRSAPLAFALHAADAGGRLRLHVRTDERSAAFLALGLAKGSGAPVPVVTTSGTAVANLHPAVLEASHACLPLLLLTADRPPELRGTGANQTTDQVGIFGGSVRWQHDLAAPDDRAGQVATWRSVASRAVLAATGARGGFAGPVHLNLPLREPLVPDGDGAFVEPLDGRAAGAPWTSALPVTASPGVAAGWASAGGEAEQRTLVLAGDLPVPTAGRVDAGALAADLAAAHGWPLVAEPSSAGAWGKALPAGSLLLGCAPWLERHRPDRVLVVGRVTLTRSVARLLRDPRVVVDLVSDDPVWPDPGHRVRHVLPLRALEEVGAGPAADAAWLTSWQAASDAVTAATRDVVDASWPSGTAVARAVLDAVSSDSTLVVGASNPVRDLDLAGAGGPLVVANRGLAGIDGCLSTACGTALASGRPTYALVGDLTFAHDAAALRIGPHEPSPDLTVVVVNDDGGGIFTLLEPGEPQHAAVFERVFGTPLGLDLALLCAATGTPHVQVGSADQLRAELASAPSGLRVLEVRVDRSTHRGQRDRLKRAATAALAAL